MRRYVISVFEGDFRVAQRHESILQILLKSKKITPRSNIICSIRKNIRRWGELTGDCMKYLPSTFKNNIVDNYGEKGREWLERLGDRVQNLSAKWNLTNFETFPNLTFNYVVSALSGEVPVVLKVGIEHDLLRREAAVMTFFKNHGAVDLIDSCDGALLLKRCSPGYSLMDFFPYDEKKSVEIATNVIKNLRLASKEQKDFSDFVSLNAILKDLDHPSNIAKEYLDKAKNFAEHLLETSYEKVAMHGDLHHDNIIYDQTENCWKVIDPFGVVGDSTYEFASFMINPIDKIWKRADAISLVEERARTFSQIANVDPQRLKQWAFVKAVLCLIWTAKTENQDRFELVKLFDKII